MGRPRNADPGFDPNEKVTIVFSDTEKDSGLIHGSLNGRINPKYPHGFPRNTKITMTRAELEVFNTATVKHYKQVPAQGSNGEMEMMQKIVETKRFPYEIVT